MNIIVDLDYQIQDGTEVVFRSPVDCSQVTGLLVNHTGGSQEFMFADAHGNNVGDIDHLFAENVAVKVILDVTTGMAFVQNADTNAYLEGRFATIDAAVDDLNNAVFEIVSKESPNLFDPETAEITDVFGGGYWQTGVIPCGVGDTIYARKVSGEFGFGVCLVGVNGETVYPELSVYKYVVANHSSIPQLLGVRVLVKKTIVPLEECDTVMVALNEKPTAFVPYYEPQIEKTNLIEKNREDLQQQIDKISVPSRWTGKNVLVFGDSISTDYYADYTKWATVLKDSVGFNLFNYSVHGYGFVCGQFGPEQGEYNMINQIERANTELTAQGVAPDLIILFMGTNDFGTAVPIGKAGDGTYLAMYSTNTYLTPKTDPATITTFYGGVEHCMARIKQLWGNALVCVLTPMQRINQTSATEGMALVNYRDIIVETAKRFTFPVKDLYNESNFSPCNPYDRETKTYQLESGVYDGLHPNEAYSRDVLAPMIGKFIENI